VNYDVVTTPWRGVLTGRSWARIKDLVAPVCTYSLCVAAMPGTNKFRLAFGYGDLPDPTDILHPGVKNVQGVLVGNTDVSWFEEWDAPAQVWTVNYSAAPSEPGWVNSWVETNDYTSAWLYLLDEGTSVGIFWAVWDSPI